MVKLRLPLSLIRARPLAQAHAKSYRATLRPNVSLQQRRRLWQDVPSRVRAREVHGMSTASKNPERELDREVELDHDTEHDVSGCKVVSAAAVAERLLGEVKTSLEKLGKPPLLVGFLANQDPAAKMYASWTEKTCTQNGVRFELREVDKDDLEEQILAANVDDAVGGILVYYPVFGSNQVSFPSRVVASTLARSAPPPPPPPPPRNLTVSVKDSYLQQITSTTKDVEGLSHAYLFNMYQNIRHLDPLKRQKSILPCTPLAIVKILEHISVYNSVLPYGNRLFGRTITVVNRSEIVGRPLAALLANDGANVYSVDVTGVQHFTRGEGIRRRRHQVHDTNLRLEDVVPKSDVVITGVPSKTYKFPTELLKDGTVCVNFSSEKNFDASVKEKASIYVPAIGKVTIVVLLRNLMRLLENRQQRESLKEA